MEMSERCPHNHQRLDIRSSSYAKASVFLNHLQSTGLLSLGLRGGEEAGKTEEVRAVERQHELFRLHGEDVKVTDPEAFRASLAALATSKMLSYLSAGGAGGGAAAGGVVAVLDLYRFPRPLKEALEFPVSVLAVEGETEGSDKVTGERLQVAGEFGECLTGPEVCATHPSSSMI